jgi:Transglycosylase SLT domain
MWNFTLRHFLFIFFYIFCVQGCATSSEPNVLKLNAKKDTDTSLLSQAQLLFFLGGTPQHSKDTVLSLVSLPHRFSSNPQNLKKKIEIKSPLSLWEQSLLSAQGLVTLSFESLRQKEKSTSERVKVSKQFSGAVLATQGLSIQIYRWALSAFAIAHAIELSNSNDLKSIPADFTSFQNSLCAQACDFAGWIAVSEWDNGSLSLQGFSNRLLAQVQFQIANEKRPDWLSNILNPSKKMAQEKIVAEETDAALAAKLNEPIECKSSDFLKNIERSRTQRHLFDRNEYLQVLLKVENIFNLFGCENQRIQGHEALLVRIENMLWIARVYWEFNQLSEAKFFALKAKDISVKSRKLSLIFDSIIVLYGRIYFEEFSPQQYLEALKEEQKIFANFEKDIDSSKDSHGMLEHGDNETSKDIYNYLSEKIAFASYQSAKFKEAQTLFLSLAEKTDSSFQKAKFLYWAGRAAQGNRSASFVGHYQTAGSTDPLSIYDIFSGQMLGRQNNRASSSLSSPFLTSWRLEYENLAQEENSENLFSERDSHPMLAQFALSLQTATLNYKLIKASQESNQRVSFEDGLASKILKSELLWLRQNYLEYIQNYSQKNNSAVLRFYLGEQITRLVWLTSLTGDYSGAISFIGSVRDFLEDKSLASMNQLFFIFYPRPFQEAYLKASQTCRVDIDLLYAISRQESLFQPSIKSPVGAVGLMQLMPSTAKRFLAADELKDLTSANNNTKAGACYLEYLLARYNNNLTFAIAAYNAGESKVDSWILRRFKTNDLPFFIEFIPIQETKDYVQKVLRNYYNIKWIYSN